MTFHLHCEGCNTTWVGVEVSTPCPSCGQPLSPSSSATTRILQVPRPVPGEAEAGQVTPAAASGGSESDRRDLELVGQQVGPYEIQAFLGKGGMARVYRARHDVLHRTCAVKVLDPDLASRDPEYVELFLSEARSAAALSHPNVVTVHSIGRHDALSYIDMEYVEGDSLQAVVARTGRLSGVRATEILVEVCAGLAAAHDLGIIHRDVKPANVLLGRSGVAKLADFGLAKRVVAGDEGSSLLAGAMVGTPFFMAPELFHRVPASRQSDVYALGVTYFYLLTGELPFVDTSLECLARQHATRSAVPEEQPVRPELPDAVVSILRRALAKDLEARYADARELHRDLSAVFGGMRALSTLLRRAFEGREVTWTGTGERFEIVVPLPGGRKQRVVVEGSHSQTLDDRLLRIYSVCAPLDQSYALKALRMNAEIPHGSLAVQDVGGVPHFVMVDAYPRSSCDPPEVRKSVLEIARWADHVESLLTGRDEN